jgi:hypothetical protein
MSASTRAGSAGLSAAAQSLSLHFTPARRRAVRHALVLSGVLAAVIVGIQAYQGRAIDAYAYWSHRSPVVYDSLPGTDGAFLYSPAFAQAVSPLTALPWQVFLFIWLALLLFTMAWLTGPLLLLPAVVLLGIEIEYANVHLLLAAAIVLGFRLPWTWALPLLTKVTPGVGLLWFVRRHEWRALALAVGATVAIAAISVALDPAGWVGWLQLLLRSAEAPTQSFSALVPLLVRLPAAAAIVWWGAGRDAKWTVPLAATLALPVIWPGSLALLLGIIPLARASWRPGWRAALA